MKRTDIINHLAKKVRAQHYLEIGVRDGINFNSIAVPNKVGVDPDPESLATLHITSDDFFAQNNQKFDLIFIDGLHHADQVERDILNSLEVLSDGGAIVCHDMNPTKEAHQVIPSNGGIWNGDCWKAFVSIRASRSDLEMFTVNTDYGCSVIRKGKQKPLKIKGELTYKNLEKNRNEWLNLVSPAEFYERVGQITLDDHLHIYLKNPNDPENNFQMAFWYDSIGQTASAVSYYLRAAERAYYPEFKYECLIRASLCFNRQGSRNFTVKGLLQHAIAIMPNRPEAYYLLSRHFENEDRDGHWTDCYMMACIGEQVAAQPHGQLRTWVDYPGAYGLTFQRALSSWHCGLCEESRDLFKALLRNREVADGFKHVIINNLKWMNVYHEIPFDTYTLEKFDRVKHKFPGLEDIKENFSEAYQDMFVLTMFNGKKNGTFLEIGAGSPFFGSNTVLLEQFGWRGHGFDINPLAVDAGRKTPCVLKDALSVNYDELLSDMEYGDVIDYLQVDLEPAEITFAALKVIPFDKYKFKVITFEHDYYNDESKSIRDQSREYLKSKGYELLVTNVAPDTLRVFEDWWVHPDFFDEETLSRFRDTSDRVKKAEDLFIGN